MSNARFVIVGGGIAGVSCAETLAFFRPDDKVVLVTESSLIKTVTNLHAVTQTLTEFDIEEKDAGSITAKHPNVSVVYDSLVEVRDGSSEIITGKGAVISYEFLCLCMGARPKLIPQASGNSRVLGIRDTDSVEVFLEKLSSSKKVVVVGNGGIASELVYKTRNAEVDWVVKDKHTSATFVDPGAAEFLRHRIVQSTDAPDPGPCKRMRYEEGRKSGAALGPDWYKHLNLEGSLGVPSSVNVHFECEVADIQIQDSGDLAVTLNNGRCIDCDFVVSATGVRPATDKLINLALSDDGGIKVNEFMQTSVPNVYAAGDVCTPCWPHARQWFPMKLWTQARQMGCYAAKCMSAALDQETVLQDFCFELFTHTTRLFGYKVVLLGLYNGQKLGDDYEILMRTTKETEYIKLVLQNDKLQGAVLIGETDLEETCENLILNEIDLSAHKDDLLNPNVDIEDYFD